MWVSDETRIQQGLRDQAIKASNFDVKIGKVEMNSYMDRFSQQRNKQEVFKQTLFR